MSLSSLSMCGPRASKTKLTEITDARAANDPTKTYRLRARMRSDADQRWQMLGRTIREAVVGQDLVGMRGIGLLPYASKIEGFARWLKEEIDHKVFSYDGHWVRPYVQQAAQIAQAHVDTHAPGGRVDAQRVADMEAFAVNELTGIVEVAQQQIMRSMTNSLMRNDPPTKAAYLISAVIRHMRQRTRAMSEHMIARTHATCCLNGFRNAGVARVGLLPERPRKKYQRRVLDARKAKAKRKRKKRRYRPIEEVPSYEEVDVLTAGDDLVCPVCEEISENGPYELEVAEDLIPAHPWCLLPGAVVEGRVIAALESRYAGPVFDLKTRNGKRLRVTGQHPILTARGWIAAQELREGDQLVSQRPDVWLAASALVDKHQHNGPALIEDVFRALRAGGLCSIAPRSDYLHGDARYVKRQINAVFADRRLLGGAHVTLAQGSMESIFELSDTEQALIARFSASQQSSQRRARSAPSYVCSNSLLPALRDGPAGVLKTLSLGSASHWKIAKPEPAFQSSAAHAEFFGTLLERYSIEVELDEVINIERFAYTGHVYDLQTVVGHMIANGIVISNCRCAFVPAGKYELDAIDGEGPGHPFRGNQHTSGQSGGGDIEAKHGEPITFTAYHGTGMDKPHSTWFTTHRGIAGDYARTSAEAFGGKPGTFETTIEAKNPYVTNPDMAESLPYDKEATAKIREAGYDVIMSPDGHEVFVLDPSIIKSARRFDTTDFAPDQPRAPAGSSEGGQWTSGSSGSGASAAPVVAFHGTIETVVQKIMKEGLRVTPGGHHFNSDVYQGERGESVFVTTNQKTAEKYASSYAQNKAWLQHKPINPVVFKLEIPKMEWDKFKPDYFEKESYFTKTIPPEWIKGVVSSSGPATKDADVVHAYMVIFVSTPDVLDEEVGHPFRGNQYVEGESGGGEQQQERWTWRGGPHGEEWQGVVDDAIKQWQAEHPKVQARTVELQRDFNEAMKEAEKYESMKDWYDEHRPLAKELFGEDEPIFEKFLAAGSIQAAGAFNVKRAIEAYAHYKLGGSFEKGSYGDLPVVRKQFARIARGEEISGEKIIPFAKALSGDLDQAVMDRWMKRLIFRRPQTKGGSWQNDAGRAVLKSVADKMGWKTAQVQAALWAVAKSRVEGGLAGDIFTYKQFLKKQETRIRSIMHTVRAFRDAEDAMNLDLLGKLADAYRDARLLVTVAEQIRRRRIFDKEWEESEHPREPAGTSEGGRFASAEAFVSPHIGENLTVEQAMAAMGGERHKQVMEASRDIDQQLGIDSTLRPALGAWSDGAENSVAITMRDTSPELARAATAMKGWVANQKAVLEFEPDVNGDHAMLSFDATGSLNDVHETLSKGGVEFHTLEPVGENRYKVHVFAQDQQTHDAVGKVAGQYGAKGEVIWGHGHFIGSSGSGTDAEQRAEARAEYEKVISEAAATSGVRGRDIEAVWEKVRHRWGSIAKDATWWIDEEVGHPFRGNQYTGGIEGAKKPAPADEPRVRHIQELINKAADPRIAPSIRIDNVRTGIESEYGQIEANAVTFPNTGEIVVFARNTHDLSDKQIEGIIRHESMHQKYNDVQKEAKAEFKELMKEIGGDKEKAFKAVGEGLDPSKYPVMAALDPYLKDQTKLAQEALDHPVSRYADQYWEIAASVRRSAGLGMGRPEGIGKAIDTATHETLAEIARREYEDGELPKKVPTWIKLYKTINKQWESVYAKRHPR